MASIYDEINEIKKFGNEYDNIKDSNQFTPEEYLAQRRNSRNASADIPLFSEKFIGYGDSKYDKGLSFHDEMNPNSRSLEDLRASHQPWTSQIANNLVNMGTIAATTFVDSFAGTAAGLVNAMVNPTEDDNLNPVTKRTDAFVNNPVSVFLNSINKSVKEAMPTYTSDKYRENRDNGEWYKNIFTPEFLGETILENAGFTIGMATAGQVSAAAMSRILGSTKNLALAERHIQKALKKGQLTGTLESNMDLLVKGRLPLEGLDASLGRLAKSARNKSLWTRNVSGGLAVMGEARQEGINSSLEYGEQLRERLKDFNAQMEMAQNVLQDMYASSPEKFVDGADPENLLQGLRPEYIQEFNAGFEDMHERAEEAIKTAEARVASMDFGLNFPILMGSSLIQFGKSFSGNYSTQKGFRNRIMSSLQDSPQKSVADRVTKDAGKYALKNRGALSKALHIAKNPFSEFNEEMLQASAQTASERFAGTKANRTFTAFDMDPESEQDTLNMVQAVFNGIMDTYGSIEGYEEGFVGLFMGAAGSPSLVRMQNAKGNKTNWQGGIFQEIQEMNAEDAEIQEWVDQLNKRLEDPTTLINYKGMIAHNALEKYKQEALDNNDEVAFENSEHAQFISDMMLFDRLGKVQDFLDNIDGVIEDLEGLDKPGMFEAAEEIRAMTSNSETKQEMFKGTDEDVVNAVIEYNKELKEKALKYIEISNDLNTLLGDTFRDSKARDEMIYLFSQIDNMETRYNNHKNHLLETLKELPLYKDNVTTFPIVLDNREQNLTFEEILTRATPDEFINFVIDSGKKTSSKAGENYDSRLKTIVDLFKTEPTREDNIAYNVHKSIFENAQEAYQNTKETLEGYKNRVKRLSSKKAKRDIKKFESDISDAIEEVNETHSTLVDFVNEINETTAVGKQLVNDINAMIKVYGQRVKLLNTYNSILAEPKQLEENIAKDKEEAIQKQTNIQNGDFIDRVKKSTTFKEIREALADEATNGNTNAQKVLEEMGISSNENYTKLVSDYLRVQTFEEDLMSAPSVVANRDGMTDNVVSHVWNRLKDKVNSYDEILNLEPSDEDILSFPYWGPVVPTPEDLDMIRDIFKKAVQEVDSIEKSYSSGVPSVGQTKSVPASENPNKGKHGMDSTEKGSRSSMTFNQAMQKKKGIADPTKSPPISKDTKTKESEGIESQEPAKPPVTPPPASTEGTSSMTFAQAQKQAQEAKEGKAGNEEAPKGTTSRDPSTNAENTSFPSSNIDVSETNKAIADNLIAIAEGNRFSKQRDNGLHELDIDHYKETKEFKGREGTQYEVAANYLHKKGAFEYVNSGKIKVGDTIYPYSSPEYWEALKKDSNGNPASQKQIEYVEEDHPLLLVVESPDGTEVINGKRYQIVGTGVGHSSNPSKEMVDFLKPSVVTYVHPGRIGMGEDRKVSYSNDEQVYLAVSTGGGNLELNGLDIDVHSVNPEKDIAGRVYMLVPGADGAYIPLALKSKRFSVKDLETGGEFSNKLNRSLISLSAAIGLGEHDRIDNIIQEIRRDFLYIGSKQGSGIRLDTRLEGPIQSKILTIGNKEFIVSQEDLNDPNSKHNVLGKQGLEIKNFIAQTLEELNVPYQINMRNLNTRWALTGNSYNKDLIDAGMFVSNHVSTNVRGAFFRYFMGDRSAAKPQSTTEQTTPPKTAAQLRAEARGRTPRNHVRPTTNSTDISADENLLDLMNKQHKGPNNMKSNIFEGFNEELTQEVIDRKIDENTKFQKENCNDIL